MKRMLTLSLGAVIAAAVTPAFGQAFPDTPENHWAYQAVAGAKAAGFLVGYPDGWFRGQRPASRYEMAAALYALYLNLKGVSDGLAQQLNALKGQMGNPDLSDYAKKSDLQAVMDSIKALQAQVDGMKGWGDEIAAIKRAASTFEKELASQGVDIESLKKGVGDLDKRVTALEGRKMPVDIHGDINLWLGAGYSSSDDFGITVDGRPTGFPRAGSSPTGVSHDLTIGHEAAMTLSSTNDTGPKWTGTFVVGNFLGDDDLMFGNQSHVFEGVPFSEPNTTFYMQTLMVMLNTSLFGQDFTARLGRVGYQIGPWFFQRPDNTPYMSNSRWDSHDWTFDGGIFDFHFGSSKFTIFGGRDSNNLQASDFTPINNMVAGSANQIWDPGTIGLTERPRGYGDHNGISVDQHLGTHLQIPLGEKGKVNLTYSIFDENGTTLIGSSTLVNRAIVFGGDVSYMFGERLSLNAGYSQSNMNLDSQNVIDQDNHAWWANFHYKADKWGFMAGYRSIDPQFYAPGDWGRIGIWWNPTDIQGFVAGVNFDVNDRMSIGATGGFYMGRDVAVNGLQGLTNDDKVNSVKAHLNYKVNDAWDLMLGGEWVSWDLKDRPAPGIGGFTGGKPTENWYNLGLKYHMGENAWWSFLWQVSDYDSKGVTGFSPFGTAADRARGGFITSQIGIKY